jgi:peptidoglycan hydrolase CwlO-like protein
LVVGLGSAVPISLLLEVRASAALADPISDQRTETAQLAEQIGALGARIDNLSQQYDAVERQAYQLSDRVALVRSRLATDVKHMKTVEGRLRGEAVNALTDRFGAGSDLVAEGALYDHLAGLHVVEHALSAKQGKLQRAEQANHAAVARTAGSLHALRQASSEDQSLLSSLNDQLEQLAAEQEDPQPPAPADTGATGDQQPQAPVQQAPPPTAPPTSTTTTTTAPAPTTTTATAAGGASAPDDAYANPLRSVSGLTAERIDQGVDYGGVGPLYALGPGVITSVYNSGWPNGVFIVEELTAGPDAGQYWYSAEYIAPAVAVGEQVSSGTIIGTLTGAAEGIELGWADPASDGQTMAAAVGQAMGSGGAGSTSTAYGVAASDLLAALGAPPGVS